MLGEAADPSIAPSPRYAPERDVDSKLNTPLA